MAAHVDRHAVDRDCEVSAMVEVVAAQEILVGFALAAVLGNDQAWRDFERFRWLSRRSLSNLLAGECHFAGCLRRRRIARARGAAGRRCALNDRRQWCRSLRRLALLRLRPHAHAAWPRRSDLDRAELLAGLSRLSRGFRAGFLMP